jgi:transcription-repair coupling factor (superfamily II helicase)
MTEFERALINRDGISEESAKLELKNLLDFIKETEDLMEIEDFLMDEYGLEPDYLQEVLWMNMVKTL